MREKAVLSSWRHVYIRGVETSRVAILLPCQLWWRRRHGGVEDLLLLLPEWEILLLLLWVWQGAWPLVGGARQSSTAGGLGECRGGTKKGHGHSWWWSVRMVCGLLMKLPRWLEGSDQLGLKGRGLFRACDGRVLL